jgi:hypothetical protein
VHEAALAETLNRKKELESSNPNAKCTSNKLETARHVLI